jgi:hypothetical protein
MTGVWGQNRRISGYHMARQLRSETGLVIEKQRSTTSDLEMKVKMTFNQISEGLQFELTGRKRNVGLSRGRRMCPTAVVRHSRCPLFPTIFPIPELEKEKVFKNWDWVETNSLILSTSMRISLNLFNQLITLYKLHTTCCKLACNILQA